jgi:integrase
MAVRKVNGKWRADWRDEFGIRRRKFFDLKANAENHESEERRTAREDKTGAPPACDPNVTLNEYSRRWLENRPAQGIDPGTVARNEIDLRRHILPRFGTTKVKEIRRQAAKALLLSKLSAGESGQGLRPGRDAKRTRKKLARGSVRSIYHALSGILSEAVEDRLIPTNPIRGLWKKLNKSAKTDTASKVKALEVEQARRFLAAAQEHAPEHYPYFCTLIWAGLRPAEGMAVRAEKIEARGRSILVDAQIGQHGGLKSTKTGEDRTVDLSARLVTVLGDAFSARRKPVSSGKVVTISGEPQAADASRPLGPWLFYPDLGPTPSERDVQRVYKRALNGMRRALEKAGLPTHFSLHSLRHTFGSGLISRGVSPAYVQQQMGHASIEQTVDTYGSWFPVRVPGAVDALTEATAPEGRGHQVDTLEVSEASRVR